MQADDGTIPDMADLSLSDFGHLFPHNWLVLQEYNF